MIERGREHRAHCGFAPALHPVGTACASNNYCYVAVAACTLGINTYLQQTQTGVTTMWTISARIDLIVVVDIMYIGLRTR